MSEQPALPRAGSAARTGRKGPVPAGAHVLVTGGSSGIGFAIARSYAQRGARVTLVARGVDALDDAARRLHVEHPAAAIAFEAADIARSEAITAALERAQARFGPCDVVIACAGLVTPARFDAQPAEAFDRQISVNLIGTANTIRAALQGLRLTSGRLMIVGSGAGLIGLYGYAAYCASKSALTGLADSLRLELAGDGISVSLCYPPDTDTPQLAEERPLRPAEAEIMMGKVAAWPTDQLARRILAAIDRRRANLYFTPALGLLGYFGSSLRPLLYAWFGWRIRAVRGQRMR